MITENTLRLRIEAAKDGSLTATLSGTTEQLKAVDEAQQEVAKSAQAMATAEKDAAEATKATGETADEAAARIKAMVQASLARAEAEQQAAAASTRSAQSNASTTVGLGRLVEAQNRAMAGATRMVQAEANQAAAEKRVAAIAAQREELGKLVGQIDPTISAFEKLDAQQARLNSFRKAGVLGEEEYQHFSQIIDQSRSRIKAAGDAMAHFSLNNANARRELGYIVKDISTGQWGRLQQSLATLTTSSGLLESAFSATGLSIAAGTAAVALFAVGAAKGYLETERLRVSVIQTGGAVGTTAAELNQMAVDVGRATGKWSEARQAVELLAASGKVAGAGIGGLARQAVDMATVTGQSIDQAVAKILQLGDAPSATIAKLNEQYHFLTSAEYAQIAALEAEGRTREAARLANQLDAQAMAERARDVQDNAGILVRAGHEVAAAWGAAWDAIKGFGRKQGLADQVAIVQAKLDSLTTGSMTPDGNFKPGAAADSPQVKALQAELASLRAKQWQAGLDATNAELDSRANQDAIAAQQRLSHYMTPAENRDNALKKAAADRLAAMYGVVDPATKARIQAEYETQVQEINNSYAAAVKKLAGPKSHSKEPAAYAAFVSQVDALDTKTITADNAALTQYEQGVRKLADEMGRYIAQGGDATKAAEQFNRGQQALQKTLDQNHARERAATDAYAAALDQKNQVLQRSIDDQVASIGMGQKEFQRHQQITAVLREEADARAKLAIQLQKGLEGMSGGITQSQYDADIDALTRKTAEAVSKLEDGFHRIDQTQADWTRGAHEAFKNFADDAANTAKQVAQGFGQLASDMEDDLAGWLTSGKLSFASFEKDFENMLAHMVAKALIAKAITGASQLPIFGGGLGTIGAGLAGGGEVNGSGTGTSDSVVARLSVGEHVINQGATSYYGHGLMEAINAKRLPRFAQGGPVGVAGGGGSGGAWAPAGAGNVIVNVYGADNGAKVNQRQQGDGTLVLDVILNAVARDVANGGKVGQAVNQVTGTRRPARSYATPGS